MKIALVCSIIGLFCGDNNPMAGRVSSDGHSMNGDKLCPKSATVMCVSIAGSNGWSWEWEIDGDKLLQHGVTAIMTIYLDGRPAAQTGIHQETIEHDIPPDAMTIRVMGGQGIKRDTGYDYFYKRNDRWASVDRR